jgi:hypothetical protein
MLLPVLVLDCELLSVLAVPQPTYISVHHDVAQSHANTRLARN